MDETVLRDRLRANLQQVRARIAAACSRVGRTPADVTLVAVTKYVEPATAAQLVELGVRDLGESRPQELWRKAAVIPQARWHLVGHLQRNKVAQTLPVVTLIHSVDSLRLLQALDEEAARQNVVLPILLEVNASREAAKHGFAPEELLSVVHEWRTARHVRIDGLMTMAAAAADPEQARPIFRHVRELRERIRSSWQEPACLPNLSMGMTGDFEVAIEEGATFIRIGSALFAGCSE